MHDPRHSIATNMIRSGEDARVVSGLLGHSKAAFTLDVYTHPTTESQQRAMDRFSKLVWGG
jgi:site-specific recombinase XerD